MDTRRVAKVKDVFIWQQIAQRLHHVKADDAGIENSDWPQITHAARKVAVVEVARNCDVTQPFPAVLSDGHLACRNWQAGKPAGRIMQGCLSYVCKPAPALDD